MHPQRGPIRRTIRRLAALVLFLALAGGAVAAAEPRGAFDYRETPLSDVLRMITLQTRANVVASPSIRDMKVSLYLRDVKPSVALQTLCKNYGLWYKEEAGVIRVMSMDEFAKGLTFGREETVRHFPLKYASCLSIAELLAGIYGERVSYAPPKSTESYGHVGTDEFPSIGKKPEATTKTTTTRSFTTKSTTTTASGDAAPVDALKQAVESIGSVDIDSLSANRIYQPSAFLTTYLRDNSIVLRSVDDRLTADIARLIGRLDTPTRQVLLETKILEINLGDGFESFVDLSFEPNAVIGADGTRTGSATGVRGISTVNQGALTANTFGMQYVNDLFSAKLELYASENRVRKISSPLMLCANNASAKFFQGAQTSLRKGYRVETNKDEEGNIVSEHVIATLQDIEAGVKLEISPSINDDGTVALKIVSDLSTVQVGGGPELTLVANGKAATALTDAVNTTSIQDIVVAHDGQYIALGGLIEESDVAYRKHVPYLGKIPLLGFFFRSTQTSKVRKEVVFLLRPHIIAAPQDGRRRSDDVLDRASEHPFFQEGRENLFELDRVNDALKPTSAKSAGDAAMQAKAMRRLEREQTQAAGPIGPAPGDSGAAAREEPRKVPAVGDAAEVASFLEAWAAHWSDRDFEAVGRFYHEDFRGGGLDREGFLKDRESIVADQTRVRVVVSGVGVERTDAGVVATFHQEFFSDAYCDQVDKTMVLRSTPEGLRIVSEERVPGTQNVVTCPASEDASP